MKPVVYIALSQFCEHDDTPRRRLLDAGYSLRQNLSGRRLKHEEIASNIGNAQAVIAGVEPYDASILAALPHLRCISRCGVGVDAIDLNAARRQNVAVLTTPEEVAEPAAQLAVSMILALARNLPRYNAGQRQKAWRRYDGHLISEWVIGLVGFGRIGRRVATYLACFGPKILVCDPRLSHDDAGSGIELCDFNTLLRTADVVSLHASRRPEEGPIMNASAFEMMKRGGYVVNTARGYLVDENALCEALSSGKLAGAALDVYSEEPYSGPLLEFSQVLCTPHVATLTNASRSAMELRAAENIISFFAGLAS